MKQKMVSLESQQNAGSAWVRAEQAGLDMSLVEANLRRTPLERMRQHDRALHTALSLRLAMKEQHG